MMKLGLSKTDKYDDVALLAMRNNYKIDDKSKKLNKSQSYNQMRGLNRDQVIAVLKKSEFMQKHVDRADFNKRLKNLSEDEIDVIETKIANEIIENYQKV